MVRHGYTVLKIKIMTIETKFDPADTVWIMVYNKPKECIIYQVIPGTHMKGLSYQTQYTIEGHNGNSPTFYENEIFRTKKELINSL
jgi:hypothetical protein